MNKKHTKKLRLDRQTIATLSDPAQRRARGGWDPDPNPDVPNTHMKGWSCGRGGASCCNHTSCFLTDKVSQAAC